MAVEELGHGVGVSGKKLLDRDCVWRLAQPSCRAVIPDRVELVVGRPEDEELRVRQLWPVPHIQIVGDA
jgi:hypothetical protein